MDHEVSYSYNSTTGALESSTGVNGKQSTFEYGPFFRKQRTINPNRMEQFGNIYWATKSGLPDGALTYSWSASSGSSPSIQYFDSRGRILRSEYSGFNEETILVDFEYDSQGRKSKQSMPYFSDDTPQWTSFYYDDYDRIDSIDSPDGTTTTYDYTNQTTTVTVSKGQPAGIAEPVEEIPSAEMKKLDYATKYSYLCL